MAWWLLQQLATVTLLIVVVHAISRIFSLGPVARHALWAVVLIKLITPPLVAWPWAVAAQAPHTAATRPESMAASPTALFTMLVEAVSPDTPAGAPLSAAAAARQSSRPSWPALALIGWISGSLVFALVQLARTLRLARLVRRSTAPRIETLDRLAGEVAATLGVRAVKVQVVDGLSSPMVWALGRPRLLWPSDLKRLDASAMRALLTHEFAHIRRRDHWVGWLDLAAGLVWWWTPMYWHARRHIRQHAELACDAWAAESLDANRRAYADALLALCASPSTPTLPASALGIHTEDRRFLERRLAVIMRPSTPLRLSRFGLCAVAIATCLALPAFAQRPAPVVMRPVESGQQTAGVPVVIISDSAAVMPQAGAAVQPAMTPGIRVGGGQTVIAYPPSAVATTPSLPAEAQALLNSYTEAAGKAQRETEERLARERAALIEKLQKIQDTETRAGHLDEALAVRTRIRQLQMNPQTVRPVAVFGSTPQPSASNLVGMRNRTWTTVNMQVVGSTEGTVWGSGPYTDDSSVGAAAVHAGVLRPGQVGTLHLTLLPGLPHYAGSSANGVSSLDYGNWDGSFTFEGPTTVAVGAASAMGATPVREVSGALDGNVGGTLDPAVPLSQSNVPAQSEVAELPPFHPEVARPGAGITNPVPIKQPKPVYTPEAMQMRITGTVTLDVLVDETGAVKDARVRKSLDERWLDPEALKATRQWTFRPARNARNEPIPMVVMLEHEFRLRPSAEAR